MSTATDILGKVGEKVGSEIKNIKDNYATKVSLGNVSSTIDFSPYATVVSLGVVNQKVDDLDFSPYSTKASLASYANGTSVFSNLRAQRAEVDELIVKGDTTIVNTQTVEVSDNMIEVNLAADGNITTDTGGIAVNRGLDAGSFVKNDAVAGLTISAANTTAQGNLTVIDELDASYKFSSDFKYTEYFKRFYKADVTDFSVVQKFNGTNSNWSVGAKNIPGWSGLTFAPTGSFDTVVNNDKFYTGVHNFEPWVFDITNPYSDEYGAEPSRDIRYWPKYLKAKSDYAAVSSHVTWEAQFSAPPGTTIKQVWYKRMDDTYGASATDYFAPQGASNYDGNWDARFTTAEGATFPPSSTWLDNYEAVNFDEKTYIQTFGSGDASTPSSNTPVSFSGESFTLAGVYYNFFSSNNEGYYWREKLTHPIHADIDVVQSTNDGSGDIRFQVNGANVASCSFDGTNYQETNNSGYTSMSFTWQNQGTHRDLSTAYINYTAPASTPDSTGNLSENEGVKAFGFSTAVYGGQITSKITTTSTSREPVGSFSIGSGSGVSDSEANIFTYTESGAELSDAQLLWDEPKGAWTVEKDGAASKFYYGNVFPTAGDLPSASTYHGMFAHVHDTGRGYFAHGGVWQELLDLAANQTINGDLDVTAGSALKVADSSGIKINNIDLGNYASFEAALTSVLSGPSPIVAGVGVEASTIVTDSVSSHASFIDRFQFVKDGKLHVYDGDGAGTNNNFRITHNFADPSRMYTKTTFTLNSALSDEGITEIYGLFENVMAWGNYVPRYFYISSDSNIHTYSGSIQNDLSAYTGPVLTVDFFRLLWPDFEPAAGQQHSPFDA
jgi:hypothetical protein